MRHAILGAGAIGGLIGTVLSKLGESVTVVVRPDKLHNYPANLSLERPSGLITAPARAVVLLDEEVDVLWITTKTYQLQPALEAVQSMPLRVVPLLNGVDHVRELTARFGGKRIIAGTIAVEAEKDSPGRFVQRSPVVRLNLASSGAPLLGDIVLQLSNLGFACQFIPNQQTLLWGKLCFLAPFALTTSASGMSLGEIRADARWKRALNLAVGEACTAANAIGAQIDEAQVRAILAGLPSGMRSSMQKDIAAGRQLELDAIGGPIVRVGEQRAIDVSTTVSLIVTIREKVAWF
jgi:2-dehydropantoate 2-reductase